MNRMLTPEILMLCLTVMVHPAAAGEVAFGFRTETGGGAGIVEVDEEAGAFGPLRTVFTDPDCNEPKKVRYCPATDRVVLANAEEDGFNLYTAPARGTGAVVRLHAPGEPDEVRIAGRYAVVTCGSDWVLCFDTRSGEVLAQWNAEETLAPTANAPEDIFVFPDEQRVAISFQKDSRTGNHKGNRIAFFTVPALDFIAQVPLPRTRPDLHIPGNLKEQGPGPEIVIASEATDTLFASLDLYGAVAVLDLSAALTGRIANRRYLSAAPDGGWGTAFPDRLCHFTRNDREYVLVCNAGPDGGAVLLDLESRSIINRWSVPHGLTHPVYLPSIQAAVTVRPGKLKRRGDYETHKAYAPGPEFVVFDLSTGDLADTPVRMTPLRAPGLHLAAPSPESSPLVVVAGGGPPARELWLVDAETAEILDTRPAPGPLSRLYGLP